MNIRKVIGITLIASGVVVTSITAWKVWGENEWDSYKQTHSVTEYQPAPKPAIEGKKQFIDPDKATALGDIFGKIYIPRLGKSWVRLVAQGVKWHPVLNEIGIGHYPGSALPGEVGNFAVAGHRGGFGGAFLNIHRLKAGDHVYVETNQGWYSYVYLQTKIVKPDDLDVISASPKELKGHVKGERYMTLTSCTPVFVNTDRIIVWLKLDATSTLLEGPPIR